MASTNVGILVRKWKFDLLIFGHITALLFASLFILPMSMYQAIDLYGSSYLALNSGQFSADITSSIPSFMSISLDKRYGNQKVVTEGIGLAEIIKRALGWCPNAAFVRA